MQMWIKSSSFVCHVNEGKWKEIYSDPAEYHELHIGTLFLKLTKWMRMIKFQVVRVFMRSDNHLIVVLVSLQCGTQPDAIPETHNQLESEQQCCKPKFRKSIYPQDHCQNAGRVSSERFLELCTYHCRPKNYRGYLNMRAWYIYLNHVYVMPPSSW